MSIIIIPLIILLLCGIFSRSKLPEQEKQRRFEEEQNKNGFAGLIILALIIIPIIIIWLG